MLFRSRRGGSPAACRTPRRRRKPSPSSASNSRQATPAEAARCRDEPPPGREVPRERHPRFAKLISCGCHQPKCHLAPSIRPSLPPSRPRRRLRPQLAYRQRGPGSWCCCCLPSCCTTSEQAGHRYRRLRPSDKRPAADLLRQEPLDRSIKEDLGPLVMRSILCQRKTTPSAFCS